MPGVNRNTKRRSNAGNRSPLPGKPLVNQLIDSRLAPLPQGPPKDEEQKKIFIINMVRLKEQRMTTREIAEKLGVSERTIANYMAEPIFRETQDMMISEAKQTGHVMISELIADAVDVLYELMSDRKVSPFVRYKAATELLDKAGYGIERDEVKTDSRTGVAEFLREVEESKKSAQNFYIENLNIGEQAKEGSPFIVDSVPEGVPAQLAPYYQMVKPGGSLPDAFKSGRAPVPDDTINEADTNKS